MFDELRSLLAIVSQYEHLSIDSLMLTMLVAVLCGLAIYLTYRFFYRGIAYSDNFGVLIVLVSVITAFIIITIGANLVLSLGMVGALSIVRFRAAIKEPLDVAFIYGGVAVGLTAGARLYLVALVGTTTMCLVYIGMSFLRKEKRNFLLILRYDEEDKDEAEELLTGIRSKLKNKTFANHVWEATVEVKVKKDNTSFLDAFTGSPAVQSAVLVEYNGDYT